MMQSPATLADPAVPVPVSRNQPAIRPRVITTQDAHKLVVGLTWQNASRFDLSQFTVRSGLRLHHETRCAQLSDLPDAEGTIPLLLAMGKGLEHLPDAPPPGAWLFVAQFGNPDNPATTPAWWYALADIQCNKEEGRVRLVIEPRPGAEVLETDRDTWLKKLRAVDAVTRIVGVVTGDPESGGLSSDPGDFLTDLNKAGIGGNAPIHAVRTIPDELPRFTRPRALPIKTIALGFLATAGIVTLALTIPPLVAAALRPAPPPPPKMITIAIEPGTFATACADRLSAWWPRITGWQSTGTGCALASDLPLDLMAVIDTPATSDPFSRPMIIWQSYAPSSNRNPVLARTAAEQVLGRWPNGRHLDIRSLLLWQRVDLPVVELKTSEGSQASDLTARLSLLFADTPEAVHQQQDSYLVTVAGPASDLLSRTAGVAELQPIRLTLSPDQPMELLLRPRTGRSVPADLFEDGTRQGPASGERP